MKLSVVMPVYNEIDTLEEILYQVQNVDQDKEIIIIDDGSTDGTREFLKTLQESQDSIELTRIEKTITTDNIRVFFQSQNKIFYLNLIVCFPLQKFYPLSFYLLLLK